MCIIKGLNNVKQDKIIKNVKAEMIFPFVKEVLAQGRKVRMTVTGSSMYPFLRENIDSVELAECSFSSLQKGDIALIKRDNGQYILHRVIHRKNDCFFIVGDAQQWIEGPVRDNQLIAVASAVYRKDFRIACSGRLWRIVSLMWLWLRPCREPIISCFRKLRKFMKNITNSVSKYVSRGRPLLEKSDNKN